MVESYEGKIDTLKNDLFLFKGITDLGSSITVLGYNDGLIGSEGCADKHISGNLTEKTYKMNVLLP